MRILNFLDPEHASRQAGSRGPQRVGASNTIASKLDLDLVASLRGGRIDGQNPRLFSDSLLLRENTLRQYQRQEANDASLQLPGRRLRGHGLQGYSHFRWMPGEPRMQVDAIPALSKVLVIIISRIAKAVSLERADSPSAPGLGRQKATSSLVGKELVPGMRKRRMLRGDPLRSGAAARRSAAAQRAARSQRLFSVSPIAARTHGPSHVGG